MDSLDTAPQPERDSNQIQKEDVLQNDEAKNNVPKDSVVILINGVPIVSTLNPHAKEFYPSYMQAEHCLVEEEVKCRQCVACIVHAKLVESATLNATFDIPATIEEPIEEGEDVQPEDHVQSNDYDENQHPSHTTVIQLNQPAEIMYECVEAVGDVAKPITDFIQIDEMKTEGSEIVEDDSTFKDNTKDDATKEKAKISDKPDPIKIKSECSIVQETLMDSKATIAHEPLKKKDEKQSTLRKLGKIMMGSSSKTSTSDKVKLQTTKSAVSCTKRISESLLNLKSSLKSKTDIKDADNSSNRVSSRSSTPANRIQQMRSRTTALKSNELVSASEPTTIASASIGLSKSSAAVQKAGAMKPFTLGQSKSKHTKVQSVSPPKTLERAQTPVLSGGTKSKETRGSLTSLISPKLPRSTLSSTLRQSEALRRRHQLPNDDSEAKANTEGPPFVLK